MGRTILVIIGYFVALIITSCLSVWCFMLAAEWHNTSDELTYASMAMGFLMAVCAFLILFIAHHKLTDYALSDES